MSNETKGRSLLFWLNKRRHQKRRRRGDKGAGLRTLNDVLRSLEPEVFEAERQRCPVSQSVWQEVVGVRISDRTTPRRLDPDGTLLVAVASSVWAQELSLLSSTLCERLRAQGHRVRALRFAVGVIEPPRRSAERYQLRYVPAPAEIPNELKRELEAIEDEELRELIGTSVASSLAYEEASKRRPKDKG